MNDFPGESAAFAPQSGDNLRELRWKAESMIEHLRLHEAELRRFPTGFVDERLALWEALRDLIVRASSERELEFDARLEAQRVWAEEMRRMAWFIITMSTHARSEAAEKQFAEDPETLDEFIEKLEAQRPAALRLLSTDDLEQLRREGFLRPGE